MNQLKVLLKKKQGLLMKNKIPPPTSYSWRPINFRYQDEEDTFFVLKALNDNGYYPPPTVLRPIKLPPFVSDPLTFIHLEHNVAPFGRWTT